MLPAQKFQPKTTITTTSANGVKSRVVKIGAVNIRRNSGNSRPSSLQSSSITTPKNNTLGLKQAASSKSPTQQLHST